MFPPVLPYLVQSRQETSPPTRRGLPAESLGCVKNQGPTHGLEKVEHSGEDGEKGGLQGCKELLVVEGEAKEINELSLANGSEKSLKICV